MATTAPVALLKAALPIDTPSQLHFNDDDDDDDDDDERRLPSDFSVTR